MYVPSLCERVRVRGECGTVFPDTVFMVISIDHDLRTADLISTAGRTFALDAVPFSDLEKRRAPET